MRNLHKPQEDTSEGTPVASGHYPDWTSRWEPLAGQGWGSKQVISGGGVQDNSGTSHYWVIGYPLAGKYEHRHMPAQSDEQSPATINRCQPILTLPALTSHFMVSGDVGSEKADKEANSTLAFYYNSHIFVHSNFSTVVMWLLVPDGLFWVFPETEFHIQQSPGCKENSMKKRKYKVSNSLEKYLVRVSRDWANWLDMMER